jgi:hypothetical protein
LYLSAFILSFRGNPWQNEFVFFPEKNSMKTRITLFFLCACVEQGFY